MEDLEVAVRPGKNVSMLHKLKDSQSNEHKYFSTTILNVINKECLFCSDKCTRLHITLFYFDPKVICTGGPRYMRSFYLRIGVYAI